MMFYTISNLKDIILNEKLIKASHSLSFLILILFFFFTNNLKAQSHADCINALVLKDNTFHAKSFSKYGKAKEFTGKINRDSIFVPEERQSFWYLIPIKKTGQFRFLIKGDDINDDWDFMLFKTSDFSNICPDIQAKLIQPIRSNFANNDKNKDGETGLKEGVGNKYMGAGLGIPFSKPVQVKKGDSLLLYTGNWKKTGKGHEIRIALEGTQNTEQPDKILNGKQQRLLQIQIYDQKDDSPVKADLTLLNNQSKDIETLKDSSIYTTCINSKNNYKITVGAIGYEPKIIYINPQKEKNLIQREIYLQELKEGSNINLPNIQFAANKAIFTEGSMPYLYDLLQFIQRNKTIAIEVQGFVNGPNEANTKYFKTLSQHRAEAVEKYLLENGVNEERISSKGYGNENMIYPHPKSQSQNQANRRVEIMIKKIK